MSAQLHSNDQKQGWWSNLDPVMIERVHIETRGRLANRQRLHSCSIRDESIVQNATLRWHAAMMAKEGHPELANEMAADLGVNVRTERFPWPMPVIPKYRRRTK